MYVTVLTITTKVTTSTSTGKAQGMEGGKVVKADRNQIRKQRCRFSSAAASQAVLNGSTILVNPPQLVYEMVYGELAISGYIISSALYKYICTYSSWFIMELTDQVVEGLLHNGFALIRPPDVFIHVVCGEDVGEGCNVNIAFNTFKEEPRSTGDTFYHIVLSIARQFAPDMIFVSVGFDAAEGHPDNIGGYQVTPRKFALLTKFTKDLAEEMCDSRPVLSLEEGYELEPLANSVAACVAQLLLAKLVLDAQLKYESPSLKTKISVGEKNELQAIFNTLDQDKFWYLQATLKEAGVKGLSVEERVVQFALNCNYYHPSQRLILDLGDSNWDEVFTKEEKKEIEGAGCPLLRPIDSFLKLKLDELKNKKTARDAYDFSRALDIDPEEEPMLAWLSATVENAALLLLKKKKQI
ncbi:hypothetical protein BDA99DRAFT_556981 [Phascolomyces articulosus]|uniref:histone deacetylase n=1 Tax=Phascolomyces articulosus TaxID=60185 RepID=A0AAD5KNA2_9FUNG|nr:hypothetical protein BDA99DRAFT_556981 [Phascolomyces articulosus]